MNTLIVIGLVLCVSATGAVIAMRDGKKALSIVLMATAAIALVGMMLAHSHQEDCKKAEFRTHWCG
ncbi:MAG: hypothetical protein E2591_27450 [Achromobacter sp.]|uniref:hypothetical protein n=1 Tax=Achromobacter sp. TaxID=134375 RepID=UPI0012C7E847|nr:hypothetical protein [Achromobacter sp.]MPS81808.1 hypothetical protein [Achromobacter sp.]